MDIHNPRKITKDKLMVVILTADYKIEGEVHIQPASRLTDYVNSKSDENFIAITNAEVIPLCQESGTIKVEYLALNKKDIIMIYPLNTR
jgi:hypothetical protein